MTPLTYLVGDATRPQATGARVIAHVCNDAGAWGAGFVLAVSRRWPTPEAEYRRWHANRAANDFGLGAAQFVEVEPQLWVANLVGQHGLRRAGSLPPIRYDALARCLAGVATFAAARGASVHLPRIGTGLAGGKWELIEPILLRTVVAAGVPTFVYDLR